MSRQSVAGKFTVVGTPVRAGASLFAIASRRLRVREVGVFNTTNVSFFVALARFTNATGVGAGLTEVPYDEAGNPVSGTGFAGHTADGAVGSAIRYYPVGASIGSGIIWTFGESGLVLEAGTANGIGLICPEGTGQIATFHFDWDE